jgi:hypothetical protein
MATPAGPWPGEEPLPIPALALLPRQLDNDLALVDLLAVQSQRWFDSLGFGECHKRKRRVGVVLVLPESGRWQEEKGPAF